MKQEIEEYTKEGGNNISFKAFFHFSHIIAKYSALVFHCIVNTQAQQTIWTHMGTFVMWIWLKL